MSDRAAVHRGAPATIRRAVLADHAALCRLWWELDDLHARIQPGFFLPPRGEARPPWDLAASLERTDHLVVVAGTLPGEPLCGAAVAQLYDSPRRPLMRQRRRVNVSDLVVADGCRRRGVGRGLMAAVETWATERGADQVLLTVWSGNDGARAFYGALGYGPVSTVMARDLRG